jgi:hypothetical protein
MAPTHHMTSSRTPPVPLVRSRASRIGLGVLVVAAPAIITSALVATLFHASLLDYFPLVSDEIAYQRQIAAFVEAGFNGGYFTAFERPAPFTFSHFSVHGPAFPVIYGLVGRFVGWQLYSGPLFNLAVLAFATATFLAMGRLSRAQILVTGAVIVTSWWVLLMASITMQESLNQAVMIVMAGFAARLMHPETQHPGRLLVGAFVILAVASVLRPTNWVVAVPLAIVGMWKQPPLRVALATLGVALGVPFFWLLWRYVSAPIPGLAIEWAPATSTGALGMVVEYFRAHIRSNTEIFELATFLGAPFYQHVMFESVVVTLLCIPLAISAARQRAAALTADVFNLFTLALALTAFLGFYFDSEASISRVTAPFLLLVLLVYVATDVRRWIVAGVIVTNLLVAPSFLAVYRVWRTDLFMNDQSRYHEFRDQLTPWLTFDPRRSAWCNTLLTTTYAREIVAVPAGIGLSVGRPASALTPPIKSGYVLLSMDSIHDFGEKAQLQHLATTVLGELYSNRDAACH